jgi:hypothetical protein
LEFSALAGARFEPGIVIVYSFKTFVSKTGTGFFKIDLAIRLGFRLCQYFVGFIGLFYDIG